MTPDVAIRQVFDWFNANGGANRPFAEPPTVQGVNTKIGGSLDSPNSIEYAAGVSRLLGERGSARADYVFRDYNDFYILRTDLSTGKVTDDLGKVYDLSLVENSNDLERRYQGASFQVRIALAVVSTWEGTTRSHAPGGTSTAKIPPADR